MPVVSVVLFPPIADFRAPLARRAMRGDERLNFQAKAPPPERGRGRAASVKIQLRQTSGKRMARSDM
jgi:hypothetical protein